MPDAEVAEGFDNWARQGAGAKMEDAHAATGRKVLDRLTIGYDESFLDVGCGTGWATRYVAERVPTIGLCVGVDVSAELVKQARALAAGKYPVKFLVAPVEDVPFGDASFHHAFSMECLYYAKDPLVALKAVARLLKPGGTFHMVIDFYKENPMSQAWKDDWQFPMHYLSQAQWVDLFEKAGFREVKAERVFDDRPVPPLQAFPWGGFNSREDLERFRTQVGSLYVSGRKLGDSGALDPFIDRAAAEIAREQAAPGADGGPPTQPPKAPKQRLRLPGRRKAGRP